MSAISNAMKAYESVANAALEDPACHLLPVVWDPKNPLDLVNQVRTTLNNSQKIASNKDAREAIKRHLAAFEALDKQYESLDLSIAIEGVKRLNITTSQTEELLDAIKQEKLAKAVAKKSGVVGAAERAFIDLNTIINELKPLDSKAIAKKLLQDEGKDTTSCHLVTQCYRTLPDLAAKTVTALPHLQRKVQEKLQQFFEPIEQAKKALVTELALSKSAETKKPILQVSEIMPQEDASGLDIMRKHLRLSLMVDIGAGIVGGSNSVDYTNINEFLKLVPKNMRKNVVLGVMKKNPMLISQMLCYYKGDIDAIPASMRALLDDKHLRSQVSALDLSDIWLNKEKLEKIITLFPNIQEINLYRSLILDDSVAYIAKNLPHLTHLDISHCYNLTDAAATEIAQMKQLISLNISHCYNLTDAAATAIAQMKQLISLNINHCYYLTDAAATEIAQMQQLTNLSLGCSNLTAAATAIAQMRQLTNLSLQGDDFTNDTVTALAQMKQLTSLDVTRCGPLTNAVKQHLRQALPQTHLNYNLRITV